MKISRFSEQAFLILAAKKMNSEINPFNQPQKPTDGGKKKKKKKKKTY
jgi:hypothetical protein